MAAVVVVTARMTDSIESREAMAAIYSQRLMKLFATMIQEVVEIRTADDNRLKLEERNDHEESCSTYL